MESVFAKPRMRSLLEHFAVIEDPRELCKVMYPLPEVLFLVVCATIAGCDDYDEIADWGETRLDFLRRLLPYYWGVPCEDWLRVVMNRIEPELFAACFTAWASEQLSGAGIDLVAIDGKTSRRSHDRSKGRRALHLISAWATRERLLLGQEAVEEKSNETTAIPALLERLAVSGALITIDAIACNPAIARTITEADADCLLAVKDNQPTLHGEMQSYFDSEPAEEAEALTLADKGHGRIETRRHVVSRAVDWMSGHRRYPGEPRFPGLTTIGMVESTVEKAGETATERRFYISSAALDAARFAEAVRAH